MRNSYRTYTVFLLGLAFLFFSNISVIHSQVIKDVGVPYIRNYYPEEYNASPQNWCVMQDDRGVIYVGGNDGIQEYDGSSWRSIPTKNNTLVRSISKSKEGIIYIGASNDFGLLAYKEDGTCFYRSLLDKVDTEKFGDIWFISSSSHGVYFFAEKKIFRYYNDTVTVRQLATQSYSSVIDDKVYVLRNDGGIICIDKGEYKLLPGTKNFGADAGGFIKILPYNDERFLIVSDLRGDREKIGLYLYDPQKRSAQISRLNSSIVEYIRTNYLYDAEKVSENDYIIGTATGGILSVDSLGTVKSIINKNRGLQNDFIHDVFIDNNNNVWLALNSGNSFIEYSSNLTEMNDHYGMEHTALTLEEYDNSIYIGTFNGILFFNDHKLENKDDRFKLDKVKNYGAYCFDMLEVNDCLLAGANSGILQIINNEAVPVCNLPRIMALEQTDVLPDYIFAGLYPGFAAVRFSAGENGSIQCEGKFIFDEIQDVILKIISDKDGNLWLSTLNSGIIRIKFLRGNINDYQITRYGESQNLPGNSATFVYDVNNEIIVCTSDGIYKFSDSLTHDTSIIAFVKENTFGKIFNDNSWGTSHLVDNGSELWISSYENGIFRFIRNANGGYIFKDNFYTPEGSVDINDLMLDSEENLWIGTNEQVFNYDIGKEKNDRIEFHTLIRKVVAGRDSLIFNGAFVNKDMKLDSFYTVSISYQPDIQKFEIPYAYKSIRFEFSATSYVNSDDNEYVFRLKNFEDQWNDPTGANVKEYTNLPSGNYTFMVKSVNLFGEYSPVAEFRFKILAPWYLSYWAYFLYVVFTVFIVWIIVRLYTLRLKKINKRLELIVQNRTKEINDQKEKIINQKDAIEEQNLQLEKLSIVARETDNAVIIMNHETKFEWVNEGFERMYGYDLESLISNLGTNLIEATQVPSNVDIILSCLKYKKSMIYQAERETNDGRRIYSQTTLTPILDDDGRLIKLIAIDTDISKLVELEGFKESMIQMIVHDLKNPLNNVIGFSTLPPNQQYLNLINYSGQQMLDMVENILDVHKSEKKKLNLSLKKTNLNFLVEKSIAEVIFQVNEKKVKVLNNVPYCYGMIDEELIRRVIVNLLSNAVKYSPEKGVVRIRSEFIKTNKPEVKVSVSDEGVGIPENLIGKIFDKYFQAEAKKAGIARSTGLGLTFCKMAVEKHEGKIWAKSNDEKGSTFSFTLPLHE